MDVFGDHWHGLDRFDVVLCSGLIYQRAQSDGAADAPCVRSVDELLVIETASTTLGGDEPMMMFQGDEAGNLVQLVDPQPRLHREDARDGRIRRDLDRLGGGRGKEHWGRLCVHAVPSARAWSTSACCPARPA